jgi:hypothetical protein
MACLVWREGPHSIEKPPAMVELVKPLPVDTNAEVSRQRLADAVAALKKREERRQKHASKKGLGTLRLFAQAIKDKERYKKMGFPSTYHKVRFFEAVTNA